MVLKQRDGRTGTSRLRKKLAAPLPWRTGARDGGRGRVRLGRGTSHVAAGKHAVVWRPATPENARGAERRAGAIVDLGHAAAPRAGRPPPPPPVRWGVAPGASVPGEVAHHTWARASPSLLHRTADPLYANALRHEGRYDAPRRCRRATYSSEDDGVRVWGRPRRRDHRPRHSTGTTEDGPCARHGPRSRLSVLIQD